MLLHRLLLLIFLCFLFFIGLNGQGCPSTDISFHDQTSVDSFPIKYPDCHEIEGDVLFFGDGAIFNLDSLYTIYTIGGSLEIGYTQLNSISGLSQLEYIGGNLRIINNDGLIHLYGLEKITSIDTLLIKRNDLLEDVQGLNGLKVAHRIELEDVGQIEGFDNLHQVTTDFRMSKLSMQTCEGAPQLDTVGGTLSIGDAPFLRTLIGFDALQYAGSLYISNTGITDFEGLGGLAVVDSNLSIRVNDSLQSIQGMESLIRIGGDVDITGNDKLSDLGGLKFLTEVAGDLIIVSNDSLRHLDDLDQLQIVYGDFSLIGNHQMQNVDGLQSLKEVQGNVTLYYNGLIQCNGLQSLRKIGGYLRVVYNENLIDISGLSQLDSIGGDLILERNSIDTLDGFNSLRYLDGILFVTENSWLRSITGFKNLESLDGIKIEGNGGLNSFKSLDLLKQIKGNVEFISNSRLQHLPSLPGITTIEGDLIISNGPDLIDLSGLDSLRNIGGKLELQNYLDALHGLEQLESCNGGLSLLSLYLTDLDPLSNLKSINGPLSISEMPDLTNIQGLRNLEPASIYSLSDNPDIIIEENIHLKDCSIENLCTILEAEDKEVRIRNNEHGCDGPLDIRTHCNYSYGCLSDGILFSRQAQIDSFSMLYPGCTFIEGDVLIEESAPGEIHNLDSLHNVQSIGGNLHITSNLNLANLDGLSGLTSIGGSIKINYNNNLTSLDGLSSVDPIQLTTTRPQAYDLWLHANPLLNECSIAPVCGILENPESSFVIQANGSNCSDPETVRAECLVGVSTLNNFNSLKIYPNPTTGELQIGELNAGENQFEYLNIYDVTGTCVIHSFFENKLSLANLEPGVYTIIFYNKNAEVFTGRFIKL